MLNVRLTPEAKKDLESIIAYTKDLFGVRQARTYKDGLEKLFEILADYPEIGSNRHDIQPGLRRLVYQAHAIYYRIEGNEIVVGRILGPGQDPLEEL